ncbi:MAG: CarD family transcriptional regulator, partial [Rhodoplanes sp.]
MILTKNILAPSKRLLIAGAPAGHDALVIQQIVRDAGRCVVVIVQDDARLAGLAEALAFFAPDIERLEFPAWDCLPYDRVSPNPEIAGRRIDTLSRLSSGMANQPCILLTTASAALQRVPPATEVAGRAIVIRRGDRLDPANLVEQLTHLGFTRVETVADRGDYAVRGGIVDLFPPRYDQPLRFDFFGDEIDGIRTFDVGNQRTLARLEVCTLLPISEVVLEDETIKRFRVNYRALAAMNAADDPMYAAVSAGQRYAGLEHWLPLFYERLQTIFDYVPDAPVILDERAEEARDRRLAMIAEYYAARRELGVGRFSDAAIAYNPVPVDRLFLDGAGWETALARHGVGVLSPFLAPPQADRVVDAGGRVGLDFTEARRRPDLNVFDALARRIGEHQEAGQRVLIAAVSRGSRDRLATVLREHKIANVKQIEAWGEARKLDKRAIAVAILALDRGFITQDLAVIGEQDVLGERMVRRGARRSRPENFLIEASSLSPGDLVVHIDHGIGRYDGLEAISVDGAPHDCLRIFYADGDRLYLPVENIEMIGRFGSDSEGIALDRLGGAGWQARKARMKQRLREMAAELIRIAAARAVREAPSLTPPEGLFDE